VVPVRHACDGWQEPGLQFGTHVPLPLHLPAPPLHDLPATGAHLFMEGLQGVHSLLHVSQHWLVEMHRESPQARVFGGSTHVPFLPVHRSH
jgi:hypothetical protein